MIKSLLVTSCSNHRLVRVTQEIHLNEFDIYLTYSRMNSNMQLRICVFFLLGVRKVAVSF